MSYFIIPVGCVVQYIQDSKDRQSIPICPQKTKDGKCTDCEMIYCDCHSSECECDDCEESKLLEVEHEIEKETDKKLKIEFDKIYTCTVCGEQTHKTDECFEYKVTMCMFGEKCIRKHCTFAHGEKELRYPGELKCEKLLYKDGLYEMYGGCGGCHKFELCKKRWCKCCFTTDHWTGETKQCIPYCKYCKTEGHDFWDCLKKFCKQCGGKGHWTQECRIQKY